MRPFDILYQLVDRHWRIPAVCVSERMDPGKRIVAGYLTTDSGIRVVYRESPEMPWQRYPRELLGQPRAAWIRYVHQHLPGAVVLPRTPYLYQTFFSNDQHEYALVLDAILRTAPHWFDATPDLRSAAENAVILDELSDGWGLY